MMRQKTLITLSWLGFALALMSPVGCQGTSETGTIAEPKAPEAEQIVEGWSCEVPTSCFGHVVGRVRTFERRVGERRKEEQWTLVEKLPQGEKVVLRQEGGPERYELSAGGLSMNLRGELLEVLRFPVRADARYHVLSTSGVEVEMQVRALDTEISTPAGHFKGCLVHEAKFANEEHSAASGLRVETTFCEGVGEVSQLIHLQGVPHPVEFTLVKVEGTQLAQHAQPTEIEAERPRMR